MTGRERLHEWPSHRAFAVTNRDLDVGEIHDVPSTPETRISAASRERYLRHRRRIIADLRQPRYGEKQVG